MRGKPQTIYLKEFEDGQYKITKTINFKERVKIGEVKTWVEVQKWVDDPDVFVIMK